MKPVSEYITENYARVSKFASIYSCRQTLIQNDALAVFDEDNNSFAGILTPKDVVERAHILVADCLKHRKPVAPGWPVSKALELMLEQNTNVLPVIAPDNRFCGLVYKRDLLKAIWDKKEHLATTLKETVNRVEHLSASYDMLTEAQSNIDDLQLLIAPDGSIIFHNRRVEEYMLTRHKRLLTYSDNIDCLHGEYFGIDGKEFDQIFNIALAGEPTQLETEGLTDNEGQVIRKTYKTVCRPVWLKQQLKAVTVTITDITLQKTKDRLLNEQKSALKTVLFAESHIIRRPLTNILAILDLIDSATLSNQNTELFQLLKVSAEELDDSIKNSTQKIYSTYSKLG